MADAMRVPSESVDWFRRLRPSKILIMTLVLTACSSALAVWVVISGEDNALGIQSDIIAWLIKLNLLLLVALVGIISRRLLSLRRAARAEAVGSRLQRRMVVIFGLVTIIPTMIVAIFSAVFFHVGIKSWFDERVRTAIEESVVVAESYLNEHKETIRADVVAMQNDLQRDFVLLTSGSAGLKGMLNGQVALRNLTEAILFTPQRVIARSDLSMSLTFESPPYEQMRLADEGEVVLFPDDEDKIRALIKLDEVGHLYLLVGRTIDPRVLNHMQMAQGAVSDYRQLQKDLSDVQIQFSVLFVLVVLLLLVAAIWYGIYTAMRLAIPISRLISAAEKVRAGDFTASVAVSDKQDEISALGRTFNRMTDQLRKQREDLVAANRQLDERRRFTEAVFAGVSAGVVALDEHEVITLNNRVAAQLLQDDDSQSMKGMPITALLPDIAALLQAARERPDQLSDQHMTLTRKHKHLNLHVRVSVELQERDIEGYIVTFDDITELVSAQRQSAWSDVARRIAHEIKNPLTPITLSAERLKRKYAEKLESAEEREAFHRYVRTIERHVSDIREIVEEFVSFARMPSARREKRNLIKTIKEALFSAKTAYGFVTFEVELPEHEVGVPHDESLISQVLTNLLKNAAEALEEKRAQGEQGFQPRVRLSLQEKEEHIELVIEDNGPGFDPELLSTITEPYVTTKDRGTGLGLAIVKKQMEEHKGRLSLENARSGAFAGGARVTLTFPHE